MNFNVDTWYLNINDVVCMDLLPTLNNFNSRWAPPTKWRSVVSPGRPGGSDRCTIGFKPAFRKPLEHPKLRIRPYLDPKKRNPYHQDCSPQEVFWKRDMGLSSADEIFPLIWRWNLNTSHSLENPRRSHFFTNSICFESHILPSPSDPHWNILQTHFLFVIYTSSSRENPNSWTHQGCQNNQQQLTFSYTTYVIRQQKIVTSKVLWRFKRECNKCIMNLSLTEQHLTTSPG